MNRESAEETTIQRQTERARENNQNNNTTLLLFLLDIHETIAFTQFLILSSLKHLLKSWEFVIQSSSSKLSSLVNIYYN